MTRKPPPGPPVQAALLALPLLAGGFLRFFQLGKQPLFFDEVWSADLALRPWGEMAALAARDVHPLLYYSALKLALAALPLSEWSLRLCSALFATAALALAVGLCLRVAGWGAAVAVGWVLGWSSLHLYYAQEARMYTLFDLLWLGAPALLLGALAKPGQAWGWWLAWALATAAAVHTQLYGLLLWAAGAGFGLLALVLRGERAALRSWLLAQLLVALAVAPILFHLGQTAGVGGLWVPGPLDLYLLLALALFGFTPARGMFLNGQLLSTSPWEAIPSLAWAALTLGFVALALLGWRRSEPGQRLLLGAALAFGVGPILAAFLLLNLSGRAFWAPRPLIGAVSWVLIGLAVGWSALPRRVAIGLLALLLALNAGALWAYERLWVKDHGRAGFGSLEAQVPGDAVLVLDRAHIAMLWRFYDWPGDRNAFGLVADGRGGFELRRLRGDGTLRGTSEPASCAELPAEHPLALYDPAGRRLVEAERWPACLSGRPGWRFDLDTQRWLETPDILR
jgi:hypothetical protein